MTRLVAALLIAMAVLAVPAAAKPPARVACLTADAGAFRAVAKPRTCAFKSFFGTRQGVTVSGIAWDGWGGEFALGSGRLKGEAATVALSERRRCAARNGRKAYFAYGDVVVRVGGSVAFKTGGLPTCRGT